MTDERRIEVIKHFLKYSFLDCEYDYDMLVSAEKEICTKEEFEALVEWVKK